MSRKLNVLTNLRFGNQVAEEEQEQLSNYFVETQSWRKILRGDADVVYGPKGAGKSALYLLLQDYEDDLFDKGILLVVAENPRGAPAFANVKDDPPPDERHFIELWKLYTLALIGRELADYQIKTPETNEVLSILANEGLLHKKETQLSKILSSVRGYIAKHLNPSSVETTIHTSEGTGGVVGVTGRIFFDESSNTSNRSDTVSIDDLFEKISKTLKSQNLKIWLLLDRLDVAFDDSEKIEANALRALFKAYRDLRQFDGIILKIFLRTDIWERITNEGFREATHISKEVRLSWDKPSLVNLIARRLVSNKDLCEYCAIVSEDVVNEANKQNELLHYILPRQVEAGERQSETMDWILKRTSDGSGENAPRELVVFFNALIDEQVKRIERGEPEPSDNNLFDRASIKNALPELSDFRLQKVLYAEYPKLRPYLEKMFGEKSEHNPKSLARIWEVELSEAETIAEELVKVGFFEPASMPRQIYKIPFIYRPALSIIQGKAEEV